MNKSLSVLLILLCCACDTNYLPKPKAYYRIDFPEKKYLRYEGTCPFSFEFPYQSILDTKTQSTQNPCWFNIHYPQYNATVHLSFKQITQEDNLAKLIEDTRNLAMKHVVKANKINEAYFTDELKNVHGLTYDFEGNTASNFQFFLTDSTHYFFRGAMYFNMQPNQDSLAPVTAYIKQDLVHLMESFEWR
jgi:gliding motility-associated lipoprotein GldD